MLNNSGVVRILGIDPALNKTGWGVIESQNNTLSFIGSGNIITNSNDSIEFRLKFIFLSLSEIIKNYSPHYFAIEENFVSSNADISLKLGQVRGVVLLSAVLSGLEVSGYSPRTIKKSVSSSGSATKEQMKIMVKKILPKAVFSSDDEADALAVAIAHLHLKQTKDIINRYNLG